MQSVLSYKKNDIDTLFFGMTARERTTVKYELDCPCFSHAFALNSNGNAQKSLKKSVPSTGCSDTSYWRWQLNKLEY